MDYKEVFKLVKKTDELIDVNPEIRKAGEKVLKLLIKKTGSDRGGILIYDFNDGKLKILSKQGKLMKKIIVDSFSRGETKIRGKEMAVPIILENKRLGLVYLYGKKFSKKDEILVEASEDILDGRFKHEFESKDLKNIFERYVGERALKRILKEKDKDEILGKTHNCTILFADVNNFTNYSNTHPPKSVINFLNEYFSEMSKIVFKYDGTIDKFIGDAIMVIFGSPVIYKDHSSRGIKAAKEMIRKAKKIIGEHKIPKGGLSIGIATGRVIAGNIGSKKMMDYTVIGKKVNLAARLTSFAGKNEILVDETTMKSAKRFNYKELGKIVLKGFESLKIFKVLMK